MKSESSERKLFDSVLGQNTTVETGGDCNEADLTRVSFVLETAKSDESVFRILSDDIDMFAVLAYWVNLADWQYARYRLGTGKDEYLTSMAPVLILVRNTCSYHVCMRSVVMLQLPTLMAKEVSLH